MKRVVRGDSMVMPISVMLFIRVLGKPIRLSGDLIFSSLRAWRAAAA